MIVDNTLQQSPDTTPITNEPVTQTTQPVRKPVQQHSHTREQDQLLARLVDVTGRIMSISELGSTSCRYGLTLAVNELTQILEANDREPTSTPSTNQETIEHTLTVLFHDLCEHHCYTWAHPINTAITALTLVETHASGLPLFREEHHA